MEEDDDDDNDNNNNNNNNCGREWHQGRVGIGERKIQSEKCA
jgi:hypothetical protein